jgi:hypothetical protein
VEVHADEEDTGASEIAKTHTVNAHTHTHTLSHTITVRATSGSMEKDSARTAKIHKIEGSCGSDSVGAGGVRAPNGGGSVSRVCKATERSFFCDGCECLRPLLSTLHCAPCHVRRANGCGCVRWKATHLRAAWREPSRRGCCLSTCRRGVQQRCVDLLAPAISDSSLFAQSPQLRQTNVLTSSAHNASSTITLADTTSSTKRIGARKRKRVRQPRCRAVPCEVTPRHEYENTHVCSRLYLTPFFHTFKNLQDTLHGK